MSALALPPPPQSQPPYPTAEWHGFPDSRESQHGSDLLPLLGLAALGLGILLVIYLGPDIKRYVRIHNM
jgi:hypothetical protein